MKPIKNLWPGSVWNLYCCCIPYIFIIVSWTFFVEKFLKNLPLIRSSNNTHFSWLFLAINFKNSHQSFTACVFCTAWQIKDIMTVSLNFPVLQPQSVPYSVSLLRVNWRLDTISYFSYRGSIQFPYASRSGLVIFLYLRVPYKFHTLPGQRFLMGFMEFFFL